MLFLGQSNNLKAYRRAPQGFYLCDDSDNEVLLPNRYAPEDLEIDQHIDVFLYKDSEDRPIATTDTPKIQLNGYALLKANNISKHGAFFDWGLSKDLFVPFGQQAEPIREGQTYLVHMHLDDKSNRLTGTTKIDPTLVRRFVNLEIGQEVKVILYNETEIGYHVIVNQAYQGMLFKNEVFQTVRIGVEMTAYVKKVREDHKVDLSLNKFGYRAVDSNVQRLLDVLERNKGQIDLNDKSDPERISKILGMSKKTFKKAVGALYKQRKLAFTKGGIKLIQGNK